MNTRKIFKVVKATLRNNTGWLVPVTAAVGIATTGYLAAKATVKAVDAVRENEETKGVPTDDKQRIKEAVAVSWEHYVPAVAVGLTTIAVVSAGSYSMSKRAVAAVSAATMTEKAFAEYRKAVVKEVGERKEKSINESTIPDKINQRPPINDSIIVVATKEVTCCEMYTGRYFKSDMETLKRAVNEINSRILNELYVTLDEFYNLLGIPNTSLSASMGWDSDRLLELEYATVLYEEVPCLTFNYNYIKPL